MGGGGRRRRRDQWLPGFQRVFGQRARAEAVDGEHRGEVHLARGHAQAAREGDRVLAQCLALDQRARDRGFAVVIGDGRRHQRDFVGETRGQFQAQAQAFA